jgi:hypothetical protein
MQTHMPVIFTEPQATKITANDHKVQLVSYPTLSQP